MNKSTIASIGIANDYLMFVLYEVLLFIVLNKLHHIRITNVLHRVYFFSSCEYIGIRSKWYVCKKKSMEMLNSKLYIVQCITHSTYVHLLLLDVRSTRAAFLNHPNHYRWHTECRLMHHCHDLGQVKQQIATKMPMQVKIQHQIVYQHLWKRRKKHKMKTLAKQIKKNTGSTSHIKHFTLIFKCHDFSYSCCVI